MNKNNSEYIKKQYEKLKIWRENNPDKVKEQNKRKYQSNNFKKWQKEYNKSDKCKKVQVKYRSSKKYKENLKKYKTTEKYKEIVNSKKHKYYLYKYNAKKRNYNFNLTFEEFITFWQKPCFYCGDQVETIGIDRINNKEGYYINNIVSCCSNCNKMKSKNSREDFIKRCIKIAKNHS